MQRAEGRERSAKGEGRSAKSAGRKAFLGSCVSGLGLPQATEW